MKKVTSSILILLLTISFSACLNNNDKKNSEENTDENDFRTESALGLYEMKVPNYMKATSGLNADASMQFQNIFKETYLAVIEEPKQDFIESFQELGEYDDSKSPASNYQSIQMSFFSEGMEVSRMEAPKAMTINGLDAEQVEFVGKVPNIDFEIYYFMTFIEGDETLYMVMEWTLSKNESLYKETFKEMAESFKEL